MTRRARVVRFVRRWARRLAWVVLATVVATAVAFELGHEALIDDGRFARPLDAVVVVDRDGVPLRRFAPGGIDTRWAALDEISPDVVEAFLAAEDARFYDHDGVDARALLRSVVRDLVPGGRLSGASTLSQQLVKLVYGRPHGLWEKPLEMARAIELERRMTKAEILEQYLNRVPMGNGIVGVARAAEVYFGRPVSELGLAEGALLAGIPQGPSITEPRRHLDRALRRRAYVLERMRALGWRDDASIDVALADVPAIGASPVGPWRAPRFVDRALDERMRHAVSGARLETTLDLAATEHADAALERTIVRLGARGVENGAAVAIANATGEILVYVGAAADDADGAALDLLRAPRQPGSTLKPFAYELFFEHGGTPATMLADVSSSMLGADGSLYVARDYDGLERGPVSARHALAGSLNLAALDVVGRVGSGAFVDRLSWLGFARAIDADRESAAIVLGGLDVTPLELVRAYATIARGGTPIGTTTLLGVEAPAVEGSLDPGAVALVRDVLEDGASRRVAFGRDLEDEARGPFALKTGTSSGFHDAWSVAFDDDVTAVVWLGSPSRAPMDAVSGFEAAAPIAAAILGELRGGAATEPRPDVLVTVEVCALSGHLPHAGCAHRAPERFVVGHTPTEPCDLHDGAGGVHLPTRFAEWLARSPHPELGIAPSERRPTIRSPRRGARLAIARGTAPEIPLRADGDVATWELDGAALASDRWAVVPGVHTLVAIGRTTRSEPVTFEVVLP